MYIARWAFTARFGKADDCVSLLRRWEIDVGERIGWKVGSVRLVRSMLGGSDSDLEFEAHFEGLEELEATWSDMNHAHYQKEYLSKLENLIVPGTSRWSVFRLESVEPAE